MDTLLVERVHGKLVPVSVKLSPPSKFIRFVGTTLVAVHPTVVEVRFAVLLTLPNLLTNIGW